MEKEEAEPENVRTKSSKFPKAIPFVLANILLERYSGKGISGIFLLFLNRKLNFDRNISTAIFHVHELLGFLIPIFGAIIADSWLGIYKTIKWMSLVFAAGSLIVSVCAVEALNLPTFLTLLGFLIAVIGSGCLKVNLSTFGANQYKLPEQAAQLKVYFSLQVVFIKFGNLFGQFSSPILREKVKCFGMNDCYPLAFGASAIAMVTAFLMFLCGKSLFVKTPPSENMVVKVCRCLANAVIKKMRRRKTDHRNHWLDYAEEKHGEKLVAETKNVLNILILYLPLPIYWAVYMMQGSRWIFQATRMNGDIGFYTVQPDQIIILNSFFIIATLPICDYVFHPLLVKIKLGSFLQKMTIGIFLGVVAISISVYIEIEIQRNFISILWIIPQYLILAISDNFLFVSHLNFVYNEASSNMKSVMMSSVYFVMALGNLIVILVSGMKIFTLQVNELLFFAGSLLAAMVLFGFLAFHYQPVNQVKRKLVQEEIILHEKETLLETDHKS